MLKNYGYDSDGDVINLGLGTMDTCLGPFVGHQGDIDSYSSFFGFAIANRSLIVILSNSNSDSNKLMEEMIKWVSQPKEIALNIKQEKILYSWNKKLADEERARQFAEKYKKENPKATANGYGPGAIVVHNSTNNRDFKL